MQTKAALILLTNARVCVVSKSTISTFQFFEQFPDAEAAEKREKKKKQITRKRARESKI